MVNREAKYSNGRVMRGRVLLPDQHNVPNNGQQIPQNNELKQRLISIITEVQKAEIPVVEKNPEQILQEIAARERQKIQHQLSEAKGRIKDPGPLQKQNQNAEAIERGNIALGVQALSVQINESAFLINQVGEKSQKGLELILLLAQQIKDFKSLQSLIKPPAAGK